MVVIPDAAMLSNLNPISYGYGALCSDKRIMRDPDVVTYDYSSLAAHTEDDAGSQADAIPYTNLGTACGN
jgi:hypothetical protein